jgi:hypothetical protein
MAAPAAICYASTIINGRNRMGNDAGHGARFSISQGPWVVVDDTKAKRLGRPALNADCPKARSVSMAAQGQGDNGNLESHPASLSR